MHNFFLIITGPTGVGKTDLSVELAKRMPIEIVNCDVGQLYTPLSIGTAKPDWKSEAVPHHLFDQIDQPRNFSVSEYRKKLQAVMKDIWSRGNTPVLVGGSLFYIRSLFSPPLIQEVAQGNVVVDPAIPAEDLWQRLYLIDPKRAESLEKNDSYRIARALQIWETTGRLPSTLTPKFEPFGNFHMTFVSRDRAELYDRINERVGIMFDQGWVEEVAQLEPQWHEFLMEKRLIGYPEIIDCLRDASIENCKLDSQLIQKIKKKTRNYAKRQGTFWRMLQKQLDDSITEYSAQNERLYGECQELNLTLSSVDLYLDHVTQLINQNKW